MSAVEKCDNCGRELGRLENDIYQEHRVCRPCWVRLSAGGAAPPTAPAPVPAGPSGGTVVQGYARALLALVVGIPAAMYGMEALMRGALVAGVLAGFVLALSVYLIYSAIKMSRPARPRQGGSRVTSNARPERPKVEYACAACGYRAETEPTKKCPRCHARWERV